MLDVRHLSVAFGDFFAVKDVSFAVHPGEIFGFLGANGAGKTTTIRVLCGLLEPTRGEVFLDGKDVSKDIDDLKDHVGYMSQKFTLYDDLSIAENLTYVASLRKMSKTTFQTRLQELSQYVDLDGRDSRLVRTLSGGYRQQIALVAAMLHDPDIVFLDEPTAGVSPLAREKFWALIRAIAQRGKTVFVTTHYMDEAEMCHRIALMRAGEIIALGTPDELKTSTFPHGVFELTPKREGLDGHRLKMHEPHVTVGPYGLLYHAFVHDESVWERARTEWNSDYRIRSITPGLEDVFIELVEGRER